MGPGQLEIICEVEPATRPDLMHVRHQIGVMSRVASAFLIPDNHIGRATVSSIAVAHEVKLMGGRSIACLNARDRNILGFRRDLLTAAAYGVDEFLFVYGDRPETGSRSDDLSVRTMIAEARRFADRPGPGPGPFASAWPPASDRCPPGSARPTSSSPRSASRPATFSSGGASIEFAGPVFAGVMVMPGATMARKLSADIPELAVPEPIIEMLDRDPNGGGGDRLRPHRRDP